MQRLSALLLCVFMASGVAGQDAGVIPDEETLAGMAGQLVLARTKGGGDFQGILFGVLGDRLEILDGEGRIVPVAREALESVEPLDGERDPAEYFQDSASNRLILMPTGFGMEKGEFHVAAQEILIITTSYGISPRLSAWGGISIPGALVNLRYSTPIGGRAGLSLGSFLGASWLDPAGVLLPYVIGSFGHPNRNLTLGLGVPFAWGLGKTFRPVGLVGAIGGKIIVSASASIVTENWIVGVIDGWTWSELNVLLVPAAVFRIAGSRLSWDIGAVVPLSVVMRDGGVALEGLVGGSVIPIPLLSVTYRID